MVGVLEALVADARAKLAAGAYVHWFALHGTPAPAIAQACEHVTRIAAAYRDMCA